MFRRGSQAPVGFGVDGYMHWLPVDDAWAASAAQAHNIDTISCVCVVLTATHSRWSYV